MHIGFLSPHDPRDRRSFSGTAYYMYRALKQLPGVQVSIIGENIHRRASMAQSILATADRLSGGRLNLTKYSRRSLIAALVKEAQSYVKGAGSHERPDLIVAPVASDIVGNIQIDKHSPPIVFVTDATYSFIRDFYRWPMPDEHVSRERQTIRNATAVVYSSKFMAQRAIKDFSGGEGDVSEKVKHVPFGLNMDRFSVENAVDLPDPDNGLNLIFVGREWQRKGGDIALAATQQLRDKGGVSVHLTIVGCDPQEAKKIDWVDVYPYLNKNIPSQQKTYFNLLQRSHFLLLPTRADCTPMVIAEANAMGVPVITSNVGGIPSLVKNGETGVMLEDGTGYDAYAKTIEHLVANRKNYYAFRENAKKHYQDYLNWDSWAEGVLNAVQPLMEGAKRELR